MLVRLIVFILAVVPLQAVSIMDPRLPGIAIEFNARLVPSNPDSGDLPGGVVTGPGRFYRIIQDAPHQIYFGYDVIVEPSLDGKNFQIRAAPLSASPEKLREMGVQPAWTQRSVGGDFVIPEIRVGTSLRLRLLMKPGSGQEIADTITIQARSDPKSPARDFTIADGELHFRQVQLHVDGVLVSAGSAGTTGAAVWFYAAGHGRFVFSLAPHPELGFTPIGTVSGTRLTITKDSTVFEMDSTIDIVTTTDATFRVYGRHDKAWTLNNRPFEMGSADNAAWIR